MKTLNFLRMTSAAFAAVALVCGLGMGRALAAVTVPTCNSFDAGGVPIYSTATPPDATGTTNCTDYFGVANWANSPLPSSPVTGFTIVSGGSGYANPQVVIDDPTGSGAAAAATATGGAITGVNVQSQGAGYILPKVSIIDVGAGGTLGAPTCGGAFQPACGSGAMVTAVLGGPYTGGMKKFQDPLVDLKTTIPVADTTTFPGSDYYEIALVQYTQKMHASLPPTTLRGYVQFPSGSTGCSATPVTPPTYLGPVIVARKNRPVRIKFTNCLPTGAGGNLFIPTDTTYMGAGMGPGPAAYTENRAVVHLHGGATPWISDGTPHQWTAPAGEASTTLLRGDGAANVPDMFFDSTGLVTPVSKCTSTITTNCWPNAVPAGLSNDPGQGSLTYYWTNQQGGRLMFYHDHAYGITRLNVYAGEAAGYVILDPAEESSLAAATAPGTISNPANLADPANDVAHLIPLVIQDKTFVPGAAQIAAQDPTWAANFGTTPGTANTGDLWFPHVYMTNQDPNDPGGGNGFGRWDYGAWFWPPMTTLTAATPNTAVTIPCTSAAFPGRTLEPTEACPTCGCPIIPNPSGTPESFMDTPVVNGVAYPVLHVAPAAYRFRILSVGNDRSFNLSWFVADPAQNNTEVAMLPAVPPAAGTPLPLCASINPITMPGMDLGLATALLDGTGNPLNGTGLQADCWPNYGPQSGIPVAQSMWAADDRAGGAPDPRAAGPAWIQIGTEGGLLPAPVAIPPTPTNYELNTRSITVTNVAVHGLWLGPAERADTIVDFSKFAGKTLILYNDAPTPVPATDSRVDYSTDDGDQTPIGGAPNTPAGYGPNIRTIMQVVVDQNAPNTVPFSLPALQAAFASSPTTTGLFASTQPDVIVPEAAYNSAYNMTFPDIFASIQSSDLTFTPLAPQTLDQPCVTPPLSPAVCGTIDRKTIQELFTADYGRMNATLGLELPLTNFLTQTTIPYGYIDPPTEIIRQGQTQLWKITHNGVDTHFIHFHLFNVQVVNRMGWDGSVRPPDPNEVGWKETVRMNPLEDILVALQPITPTLPFPVPDSIRNMDVTGGPSAFTNIDPNNNPVTVTNIPLNFGWEYVWHCHILGHEENDMMRPMIFQVAPPAPDSLLASAGTNTVTLAWIDNSASEDSYTIQRDTDPAFPAPTSFVVTSGNSAGFSTPGYGQTVAFDDTTIAPATTYYYRVQATDSFTPVETLYPAAFQPAPMSSAWSNIASNSTSTIAIAMPLSLTFGNQLLQTTGAPQTVTLSSVGAVDLLVSGITITGLNSGDFAVSANTCGGTVAAGTSCSISVTFTPTAMGARAANLVIVSNSSQNPTLTIPLSGTSTYPVAGITPASLAFGNELINTISTAQTVTLSNTGNAPLSIVSIGTGTALSFSRTNGCGTSLAAGASCTIGVSFAPTSTGAQGGSLFIASNDPVHPTLSVSLGGTGISIIAGVTPASLAFGNQLINTVSTAQTVTLSNTGTYPLSIASIGTGTTIFTVTNGCGASLAAGASCAIGVSFAPTSIGAKTGALSIVSNDPLNPTLTVSLGGACITPVADVAPTSLPFGMRLLHTTSSAQTVTLSNTGNVLLTISSIGLTGANASDFSLAANTCGAGLAAGTDCSMDITFSPATGGVKTAALSISSNDTVHPTVNVALTGAGTSVLLSASTLVFGPQKVGTTSLGQAVTLTNIGATALSITGITLGGANPTDFKRSTTCLAKLGAGKSCSVAVRFTPKADGARTATLSIADSDAMSPQTVLLTGTGTVPANTITPGSLTFTSPLKVASAAQVATVTNTGAASMTINGIAIGGTNPGQFSRTTTCGPFPRVLAPGASCTASVTFKPTGTGTKNATLNVNVAAPATKQSVTLTGTTLTPVNTVSPASLVFGTQSAGTLSTAQTVTVGNTGAASMTITGISLGGTNPGQFSRTTTCGPFPATLAVGASCTVDVIFKPTTKGAKSALLNIVAAAPAGKKSVALSGTGQ